ncbi:MAG TPA: OmpA family protein [Kofleriaceae bacterium]|nr:OmpA family protein [Kofleriaceae bacterium]
MSNRPDTGVTVQKSVQQRRFPWRLWLYAIAMTGAAGGIGYLGYQYRDKASTAEGKIADADKQLDACHKQVDKSAQTDKDLAACKTALGDATVKLTEGSKNLNASAAELTKLQKQQAEADKRAAAIDDIQKQFAKMIDTGQLRVVSRRGELVVSLPSEVLFPSGSADLSKPGEYAVVEVAGVLKRFPDRRFLVVGHTDNQDFAKPKAGSAAPACAPVDNWQLSTERALTVTRVLVTAGMKPENVIAGGAGEHDPIASNATPDGRQKNRRIEIALLPAIDELPPLPASLKDDTAAKP